MDRGSSQGEPCDGVGSGIQKSSAPVEKRRRSYSGSKELRRSMIDIDFNFLSHGVSKPLKFRVFAPGEMFTTYGAVLCELPEVHTNKNKGLFWYAIFEVW
ncbi:MAG: hypothetical protein JW908_04995 [Anaerolineales bacterium]|nr:hypothetical protein [Anaerolineales bacterium]